MDTIKYANQALQFKQQISNRLLSLDRDGIQKRIYGSDEYLITIKYDGHFYLLVIENGKSFLINKKGRTETELEVNKVANKIFKDKKHLVIAGELYLKGDKRTHAYDLTKALTSKSKDIQFAAFNLVEEDNKLAPNKNPIDAYNDLKKYFGKTEYLHVVDGKIVKEIADIKNFYDNTVTENGLEGIVVKGKNGSSFKVKPKFTFDAAIIGIAEGDGLWEGMLRDFLLAFMKEDGSFQVFAHLSHGFSEEQRKKLLVEYRKKVVPSNFIEVAGNKVAFQMVKPDTVIEFTCLDVINEDTRGSIKKINLEYDEKNGYTFKEMGASVSTIIPNFSRFRDDKSVNIDDVRMSQILKFVELENEESIPLEKSQLLKRSVYTKESKGKIMIRKFLVFKTNKEASEEYPAYVYHYTDFSAGRKDPLKTDVKVGNSEEFIMNIYEESKLTNVKKGWEEVL